MALNAYDAAKHHIGLGPAADYGFMLVGAYNKDSQRELGGATEYGGATDLIGQAPGRSRWTQDDFTGGAYQYQLDKDMAMFAESLGYLPSQQAKSLLSVAPVTVCKVFDPSAQTNGTGLTELRTPVAMFSVAGSVFTAFPHGIARYRHDTDAFTWGDPGVAFSSKIVDAGYDMNEQMYYYLSDRRSLTLLQGQTPELVRFNEDFTQPTNQKQYVGPENSANKQPKGFQINDAYIVVSLGLRLYTCAPPADTTSALDVPTWTEIGRLPGYWIDSCSYNGMTYIVCAGLDGHTSLVAFDGTAVLPICDFPYNFNGRCIAVYGGRVYVGGTGYDLSGNEKYAELHEVTGASVRQVRSFAPEARQTSSPASYPKVIRDMAVAEGFLWLSMDGEKLVAYDLTSDGFFGASKFLRTQLKPYAMTVCRGHLYVWNRDSTTPANDGLYRIAASTDTVAASSAQLITSDFVAEPSANKSWSSITVQTRYAVATVEYSQDAGATWTALTAPTDVTEGNIYTRRYDMIGVPNSRHIRFRISQLLPGVSSSYVELIAYTVAFVFASTGKHGWTLAINGAENIEGRDGTTVAQDVALTASTIWGWRDTKIKMKDVDGVTRDVYVQHVTEQQPIIGPNVGTRPEAYYGVTLVEV